MIRELIKKHYNIPNILTLLRLPFALFFPFATSEWRVILLLAAGITDAADGFLARLLKQSTKLGTLLDPIMDKLFAGIVICTFFLEQKLSVGDCLILFGRDIAVFGYGILLWTQGRLSDYRVRAIWSGKAATFLQFVIFLLLAWEKTVPAFIYGCLAIVSLLAFLELIVREKRKVLMH